MDLTDQVYEAEATGWQRGLYADVRATFRAPIVNSIFRVLLAHEPAFTRYFWSQVKPVFGTRAFGAFSVAYRDRLLSGVEAGTDDGRIPGYDARALDSGPASFAQLRAQAATFDVVGPRLVVLFALANRALGGERFGSDPGADATAPLPEWLDADRGAPPTMLGIEATRRAVPGSLADYHGMADLVPSIYRCLAQWPDYLARAWADLEPAVRSEPFADASDDADELVAVLLDRLAATPRLDPPALESAGFDSATVARLRELFAAFDRGASDVLPLLPVYAATVGAEGERDGLTFP